MLKRFSQAITKLLKNEPPLIELLPAMLDKGDPRVAIRPLGDDWLCPFTGKTIKVPEWDGSTLTLLQNPKIVDHLLNLPDLQTKRLKAQMMTWDELVKRTIIRRLQHAENFKVTSDRGQWVCPYCMNQTSILFRNWDGSTSSGEWMLPEIFAHLESCTNYVHDPLTAKPTAELQQLQGEGAMRPELLKRIVSDPCYRVTDDMGTWLCPFTVLPVESINLLKSPWGPVVQNKIADYLLSPECPARYNGWKPAFTLAELHREAGKISAERQHGQAQVAVEKELRILRNRVSDLTDTAYSAAKFKKEIKSGRLAQVKILPEHPPVIPGYEISAYFSPCTELGGDFYNYIDAGPGKTGVMIGDVSGHGIQAALLMTSAMKSFSMRGSNVASPREAILGGAKEVASDIRKGKFISVFYVILEHENGGIRYSCAGHLPALMANPVNASLFLLEGAGLALGVGSLNQLEAKLEEYETNLPKGAVLLLHTDGIFEATNDNDEQFGQRRLEEILFQSAQLSVNQILEHIVAAVQQHIGKKQMADDCTLVAIKRL